MNRSPVPSVRYLHLHTPYTSLPLPPPFADRPRSCPLSTLAPPVLTYLHPGPPIPRFVATAPCLLETGAGDIKQYKLLELRPIEEIHRYSRVQSLPILVTGTRSTSYSRMLGPDK